MELVVTQGVQQSGSLRRPVTPLQGETETAFKQARDQTIQQEKVAGAKDLTTLKRRKSSHRNDCKSEKDLQRPGIFRKWPRRSEGEDACIHGAKGLGERNSSPKGEKRNTLERRARADTQEDPDN